MMGSQAACEPKLFAHILSVFDDSERTALVSQLIDGDSRELLSTTARIVPCIAGFQSSQTHRLASIVLRNHLEATHDEHETCKYIDHGWACFLKTFISQVRNKQPTAQVTIATMP